MDKTSMTLGYLVGHRIAGQRTKKTLVGYSYNGTVLPAPPERDKETYPYAYLVSAFITLFVFSSKPLVVNSQILRTTEKTQVIKYSTDGEIVQQYEPDADVSVFDERPFWSNTDVIYKDSTDVYLAASDPIPVYA